MALYQLSEASIVPFEPTTFSRMGYKEREHIQKLLKGQISIVSPDTLVIAEEFSEWEESKRRIDLLGIDKSGMLVVMELKRTEDGGHMELQALRYAAMVSTLTFARAVEIYEKYLADNQIKTDAQQRLLDFLELDEPDEDAFGQDVRIVLVSADFSKELTSSVIWLNDHGLDIRCVRLRPHRDGERLLLDVQQIIPLPEANDYQVRIREKARVERVARTTGRDLTRYDVQIGQEIYENLPKRRAIFQVIHHLWKSGVDLEEIRTLIDWRPNAIRAINGGLGAVEFEQKLADQLRAEGSKPQTGRYFIAEDELMRAHGKTYAFTKMWGPRTVEALELLATKYPELPFKCVPHVDVTG